MFASNRSRGRSAAAVTAAIALVVSGLLSASPATADELDAVEIVAPVENEPVEPVPTEQPEPAEGPVVDGVPDEPAPAEEPARAEQHTEPTADAAVAPLAIDEPAAQPQTPTILVSQTTGLSPAGQTVTVTGTGFGPVAPLTNGTRPPLTGRFGGAYVVFGRFADVWQPSVGAPTSARTIADQRWVVNPEDAASLGSAAVAIRPDGSFTVELTVATGFPNEPATGNYGIYTYGGSGAGYAPFETYTPVSFSTAPMITLSESTGLDPAGDTVTVRGWNFTAAAPATNGTRPPLAGRFGGAYVVLGKFPQVWQPSAGVPSSSRTTGTQRWGVNAADAPLLGAAGFVIAPDGSFTIELPVSAIAPAASGNYGVYTYAGSGAVHAPFETYTPISFAAAPVTPTTTELTAAPATGLFEGASPTLTAAVSPAAAGSMVFRSGDAVLATVPVAGGRASVTTASLAAGAHTFVATFSPADPVLHASSSGELTLVVTPRPSAPAAESPQQQGSGSLTWGVKQSFRSYVVGPIARGSVSTSGVGSSGGALVFGQAVGGDFDAATGTGTARYSGSVRFQGHGGTLDLTLADPVVRLDSAGAGMLLLTAGGAGLVPFATLDLAAGIRSTPDGTVAYTGVPATLTAQGAAAFQGFYGAGEALDPVSFVIGAPAAAPSGGSAVLASYAAPAAATASAVLPRTATDVDGCPVDDATLSWGFKESFRSYISGSIANGEWTVADGATYETPLFGWSAGIGGYDADTRQGAVAFPGSVTFTGHGGVLNTTVSNPRIEFVDADSAILLLDVAGTTQAGEPVSATAVEFAGIDLASAEVVLEEGVLTDTDAPAELAAPGAEAFGTYPAGEALDPVSFTLSLDPSCAEEEAAVTGTLDATASPEATASTGPDLTWLLWVVLAVIVLAAVAGVIVWRVRARRA